MGTPDLGRFSDPSRLILASLAAGKKHAYAINEIFIFGLAVAFYFFFMTTKHDAALSQIIPFAFDPYDAIGSFAIETAAFLGILSFIRTIRLFLKGKPEVEQQVFLARTQMGVVLAVLLTLVGDAVAMLRHLPQWTGHTATNELLLFIVSMLLLAIVVGILVYFYARNIGLPRIPGVWEKATIVFVAMVVILAFYPENLIISTVGELFTVVVGALLLFVPMWALGDALIPYTLEKQEQKNLLVQYKYQWIVVIFLGICIGLLYLVFGESTESGRGIQFFQHIRVVLVYVGLEVSAVLTGYTFLRKQLGLFRRR